MLSKVVLTEDNGATVNRLSTNRMIGNRNQVKGGD
jgi:hypothetical protein